MIVLLLCFTSGIKIVVLLIPIYVNNLLQRAVKGAVQGNFGAVEGPKRAVNSGKSSRQGLAGPGNPGWLP
jgi:hypothetical protein